MEATKRQLWALFCLTGKDWRGKSLTKEEASKLISQYKKEKDKEMYRVIEAIKRGIERGYKAEKETEEPMAIIYDADLAGNPIPDGKMYVHERFSGCGTVYLGVYKEMKLINILKRIREMKRLPFTVEIGKSRIGHSVVINGRSYSNGNIESLTAWYRCIAEELRKIGYDNVYPLSYLD